MYLSFWFIVKICIKAKLYIIYILTSPVCFNICSTVKENLERLDTSYMFIKSFKIHVRKQERLLEFYHLLLKLACKNNIGTEEGVGFFAASVWWCVTFSPLCSFRSSMRRDKVWMGSFRRHEPIMSSRYSSMPSSCSVWPLGFIMAICSTSPWIWSRISH